MNWNKDKSLQLSRVCIWIFSVLLVGGCLGAPWIFRIFIEVRGDVLYGKLPFLLATTYITAVPVAVALYSLHALLKNIRNDQVFEESNVCSLRRLSWCCFAVGMIFLISILYYVPFLALAVMAVFMSLILRVVKNVFAQAVEIKKENDYTI